MNTAQKSDGHRGFTLIEVMAAVAIFVIVCGAMFSLLNTSQKRYQGESQVLNSFQDERLALDQVVRDANDAGYPPSGNFSALPGLCVLGAPCPSYVDSPIAWNPSYTTLAPCTIGGTCVTPTGFDVIFEENPTAVTGNIEWIRYQLVGTTLRRGSIAKQSADPLGIFAGLPVGAMVPYLTNVMNNASAAQIAKFKASYPSMFPGGNPQPVFQYYCSNPAAPPATILCQNAVGNVTLANGTAVPASSPINVVDVEITLIVQTTQLDPQTKAPLLVELNGFGHRVNPN